MMAENPDRGRNLRGDSGDGKTLAQGLMFVFCLLFGLAMIADTQAAGDGVWYWYATFLHSGKHLYRDMHLALQPLYVLETAWVLALLGKGWVVSKAPAILHLVAYCVGLLLLVRRSELSDGEKAVVLGCGFFVSISFEAYRFDDYHVLADCFQLYCLVALLRLQKASSTRGVLFLCAALGVLCGLTLTTRVNDGAALLVAVAIAIACLAPSQRLLAMVLFFLASGATVALIVSLTGDSLRDYAMYSIFHAAGSKGGTGSVLTYPLRLPIHTLRWLKDRQYEKVIAYVFGVALAWVFLLRPLARRRGRREFALAAAGALLVLLPLHRMYRAFLDITVVMSLSSVAVLVAYGLGLLVLLRLLGWMLRPGGGDGWGRREILLLVPLGQLASGSMSSGGAAPGTLRAGGAAGCAVADLRADPNQGGVGTRHAGCGCGAAAVQCGPLQVERSLLVAYLPGEATVQRAHMVSASGVRADGDRPRPAADDGAGVRAGWRRRPRQELLSLPFSYANYFCNIPPWHDDVQTFFDTTSKETIQGLMKELQASPPQWIFYQRQMATLRLHELIYNHGEPLEQRHLDELIERKLADRSWQAVYMSDYGNSAMWDNEWILIRTR